MVYELVIAGMWSLGVRTRKCEGRTAKGKLFSEQKVRKTLKRAADRLESLSDEAIGT